MLKYILTIFFSFSVSIGCIFSQTYLNLDWSKDQIEVNSDYNSSLIGLFSKHYVEYIIQNLVMKYQFMRHIILSH